jgi:hypothetical protein
MSAKSFPSIDGHIKSDINYGLYADADLSSTSQYFRVDEESGVITIRKQIDYDDPATPKTFKLFGRLFLSFRLLILILRCCSSRRQTVRCQSRN